MVRVRVKVRVGVGVGAGVGVGVGVRVRVGFGVSGAALAHGFEKLRVCSFPSMMRGEVSMAWLGLGLGSG